MEIIAALVGVAVGFGFSVLLWGIQHRVERDERRSRVTNLLHLENEENLRILDEFWSKVSNQIGDLRDIEEYHRLAYTPLSSWHRLMWESQAPSLSLLPAETVKHLYRFQADFGTFTTHRDQMLDKFGTEEAKKLWADFEAWKRDYLADDVAVRAEAQNGVSGREMDKRVTAFSTSLIGRWNATNECYQTLHREGNPF